MAISKVGLKNVEQGQFEVEEKFIPRAQYRICWSEVATLSIP